MLMLGIETSGERGSVALLREDELLAEHRFAQGYRHARNIMAGVADVVRSAGVDRGEIDAVGVTDGPGSFTGLRVGVTCAKTLAWLLGLPAVGVPTLDVLAQNVRPEEHLDARGRPVRTVCPLLDARRGFVYGAVFEWRDGLWHDTIGLMAGPPRQVAEGIPGGTLVFGSGVEAYPEVFLRRAPDDLQAACPWRRGPDRLAEGRAEHTARRGLRALRGGVQADPLTLVAKYYRRTEAEEKLAIRHSDRARRSV